MKKTALLLIVILAVGCSHYIVNSSGYIRPPKNYKFPYKSKTSRLTGNIIDTTAIYYLHNSNYYRDSDAYKNGDEYIRFYADGRFKTQGSKEFPKIEDINNVEKGIVGYYILKGHLIKMQLFTDINAGSDQLEFGIFHEKGNLTVLHENPRSDMGFDLGIGWNEEGVRRKIENSSFNPKQYEKIVVPGMTYDKPDW